MNCARGYDAARDRFTLVAPGAESVELLLREHPDGPGQRALGMRCLDANAGLFRREGAGGERYYRYRVHYPWGSAEIPDPWSLAVARRHAPGNEAWSVRTVPAAPRPRPPRRPVDPEAAVVVELHVRDATWHPSAGAVSPGTYLGLCETHPAAVGGARHARALGADAVELLPLASFPWDEGERTNHWGYMPSFLLAASARYTAAFASTAPGAFVGVGADGSFHDPADDVRAMVDGLHEAGLSVVLDVVWNHVSLHDRNPLLLLDPGQHAAADRAPPRGYFHRDGSGARRSHSGCGNDLDADHPEMRALILAAVDRWIGDFGFDGLRLDLGEMLGDDALAAVAARAKAHDAAIWLSAEPWSMAAYRPDAVAAQGYAVWNDRYRNLVKGEHPGAPGLMFGRGDVPADVVAAALEGSAWRFGGWLPEASRSVSYLACHDGATLGDFARRAVGAGPGEEFPPAARRALRFAAAFLAATRGPVLLQAGQSFGRSRSVGGAWVDNAYDRDDAAGHLDWDARRCEAPLVAWHAAWLQARRHWFAPAWRSGHARARIAPIAGQGLGLGVGEGRAAHVALFAYGAEDALFVLPRGWRVVLGEPELETPTLDGGELGVRLPARSAALAVGPRVSPLSPLQKGGVWR